MRKHLPLCLMLLSSCSRSPKAEPLEMHLVRTSCHTLNPSKPPVSNPGSQVVSITSGRATGQLLHIAQGKAKPLGTFEFDASKHTLLCSTAVVMSTSSGETMDVGFVLDTGWQYEGRSVAVDLGKVAMIYRSDGGQSILEKANVLYRIERTNLAQDRWTYPHEASLQTMIETSKELDCEYLVLDVKAAAPESSKASHP